MFFHGKHKELIDSIEAIGASFAVFEYSPGKNGFFLVSCNTMYEELLGRDKREVLGQFLPEIFPRYIASPLGMTFSKCKTEQLASETEILFEYKAQERWWRSIISPIIDVPDSRIRIIQTCVEITEKKLLEKQLNVSMKRFEAVVQTAYDGIVSIDEQQNIRLFNDSARKIFGVEDGQEVIGSPLVRFIPQKYRKKHAEYVEGFKNSQIDSRPMQARASVRGLRADGSEFPVEVTISKIRIGERTEMTAVIRDISEKNRLLEELLKASQEDHLTGLYNRKYFTQRLSEEIARCARFKRGFSLMMLDIDHFKRVNDLYGHDCGDKVLVWFAAILKKTMRTTDVVSRWGGEEFLVILPECEAEASFIVAEKVRREVERSEIGYDEQVLKITCSIGLQYFSHAKIAINDMIMSVDKAMYLAKRQGRNCTVVNPEEQLAEP